MAGKGGRSYLKDLRSLCVNIGESTNEQASISSVCGRRLEILLTPNEGPYAHAMFTLEIVASDNYPRTPPDMRFLTPIFHPNIHPQGYICLSIMENWNRCYSLLDAVKAMLFLLANPNFDDPNNTFGDLHPEYRDRFDEACRQFLAGFPIKGQVHPANEEWCEWARANNCFPVPKSGQAASQPPTHLTSVIPPADNDVSTTPILEKHVKVKVNTQLSDLELAPDDISLSTPTTSVPSIANVRYSVGSTDSVPFGLIYRALLADCLQTQRILLHQQEHPNPRIFYFCDYLGCDACRPSTEPVYLGDQADRPTTGTPHASACQSSSFLDWTIYCGTFNVGKGASTSSHSLPLSGVSSLFNQKKAADTDAYELFPNCGNYVLCALFAEPRSKLEHLEAEDPLAGSVTLEDFFTLSCEFEFSEHPDDGHQSVAEMDEGEDEETAEEEGDEEESISVSPSAQYTVESAGSNQYSLNYLYAKPNDEDDESFYPCDSCDAFYGETVDDMQKLKPAEWIFFQTRWPPLLAPQQILDLEKNYPARIPAWRGSTPRLVRDVVLFCRQHPKSDCLLLLDPLALSPWSPVLNALCPFTVDPSSSHRPSSDVATKTTCRQRWMSLLWLTAVDTFRLTWLEPRLGSQSSRWLHAVARLALLSNWLAWFSRVEIAAVLGQSRRQSDRLLCEGLATACLHPASLGCGQASLFDVWPLWLGRLLLRCSCGLFVRLCAGGTTRCYFPLSDTDEI